MKSNIFVAVLCMCLNSYEVSVDFPLVYVIGLNQIASVLSWLQMTYEGTHVCPIFCIYRILK